MSNNPLALIDPKGLDEEDDCGDSDGCQGDDDGSGGGDGGDGGDQPPDIPPGPMPDLPPVTPVTPVLVVDQEVDVTATLDPVDVLSSDPLIGWIFQGAVGGGGGESPKQKNCAKGLQAANKNMAAVDRANAAWDVLQTAADANNVDPALLAAIGIEESGFQNVSENDGAGVGVGVFQITVSPQSGVTAAQAGTLSWSANYAAALLDSNMDYLGNQFSNFTQAQLLQATAASYNLGTGGISGNPNTIDVGSQGRGQNGNYGSTVVNLMDCF